MRYKRILLALRVALTHVYFWTYSCVNQNRIVVEMKFLTDLIYTLPSC
jgi:hypothetical protein